MENLSVLKMQAIQLVLVNFVQTVQHSLKSAADNSRADAESNYHDGSLTFAGMTNARVW